MQKQSAISSKRGGEILKICTGGCVQNMHFGENICAIPTFTVAMPQPNQGVS